MKRVVFFFSHLLHIQCAVYTRTLYPHLWDSTISNRLHKSTITWLFKSIFFSAAVVVIRVSERMCEKIKHSTWSLCTTSIKYYQRWSNLTNTFCMPAKMHSIFFLLAFIEKRKWKMKTKEIFFFDFSLFYKNFINSMEEFSTELALQCEMNEIDSFQ